MTLAAAAVLVTFIRSSLKDENTNNDANVEASGISIEVTDEEEDDTEYVEAAFFDILEGDSSDLTISWYDPVEVSVYDSVYESIEEEINLLTDAGYSFGFVLYDLETGGGISYCPDDVYYSASTIKGPYVVWLAQTYPSAVSNMYTTISNTISWSSNSDYSTLVSTYGKTEFASWTAEAGSADITLSDGSYSSITARSFTRLWIKMYDYFTSGETNAEAISELFIGTEESCISEALGDEYTVYSKAGWISEGEDSYYTVQNDAGIVVKDSHPYILVVLSDAYDRFDLLDPLIACLDQADSDLVGDEES